MNSSTKIGLLIGAVLIAIGLLKPNIGNILIKPKPPIVNNIELLAPSDPVLKEKADALVDIAKTMDTTDALRLRDLYLDIATLIRLDGNDMVIKSTEEIRQANSLSGLMCRLDIRGKYKDLPAANAAVVDAAIGSDNLLLTPELRNKAAEAFNALAWAFNGGK
jgi:hypothetical protein